MPPSLLAAPMSATDQATDLPPALSTPLEGGQALCLRGFSPAQATTAAAWLQARGFRVVRSMGAAQMVLAGPDSEKSLLDLAQNHGLKLQRWEAFKARYENALASPPTSGPESATSSLLPADAPVRAPLPLIEPHEDGTVTILGMTFPQAQPDAAEAKRVPAKERFVHICLDQLFINTVAAVAEGARGGYPVALEGETAASKTTAVLWLAHQLGQPVARLNLNGQTDAGELVGRHQPAGAMGGLEPADLLAYATHLKPLTRRMLEQARAEGRRLTPLEEALVMRTERLPATQWRFQESSLPLAMRRGWWLLLDEMNLAEPQILERLNCALETPPTLVLSENDGTVFGPGGDVSVHPQFRLFATLNPAEYSGRSVLSPAFRDRWSIWHQAEASTETETRQMLHFLAFGEQPVVHFRGQRYQAAGSASDAAFPVWHQFDPAQVATLIQQLALFHTSVVKAAGSQGASGLARHQRERMVFTRRSLLSVMQHVSTAAVETGAPTQAQPAALVRQALELFYINRLRDPADRKAVMTMLRAADLA